jgi:hypothetical protein
MPQQIARFTPVKLEPIIDPQNARTLVVQVAPNLTIARGTILGLVTATGVANVYASGNNDGTQIPLGPSVYDFVSDANGNVVLGYAGATQDLTIGSTWDAEVYWKGTFLESDLTGLDANAVAVMNAREVGVGAQKMLHMP